MEKLNAGQLEKILSDIRKMAHIAINNPEANAKHEMLLDIAGMVSDALEEV